MNQVYNAANKRLLMFGVERTVFSASLLAAIVVFWIFGLIAAIVIFGALFAGAKWMTREDPKMAEILMAASKMSRRYDSAAKQ